LCCLATIALLQRVCVLISGAEAKPVDSHAVQLVGYDLDHGWWLAKNSWGTGFAEGGYFRVNFTANVGIGNIEDTYGLRFVPFRPRPLPISRIQTAAAKKGCVMYRATSTDYASRVASMFGSSIEDVLLNNAKTISEPDMLLGGKTVLVCGAASAVSPPSLILNSTQLTQQQALLAIKAAVDKGGVLKWQPSSTGGTTQYCSWQGVVCNEAGDVQELRLTGRRLVGNLPRAELLLVLPKLETLAFGNNTISGPLPPEYSRLNGLKQLYVWNNPVGGSIPCTFTALDSLTDMDLSQAQLTGTLCPKFSQWTRITDVNLWGNRLTGRLPPQYGAWRMLSRLNLNKNALTGSIPGTWQGMFQLTYLNLHSNKLTGTLPASLGLLESLEELQMYRNLLTGPLPSEWSGMVSCQLISSGVFVKM
jgi:Leucine-rich repeat (LRR) protein